MVTLTIRILRFNHLPLGEVDCIVGEVALLTETSCIVYLILMVTLPGQLCSSLPVVTCTAHVLSIVLSIGVGTCCYLLSLPCIQVVQVLIEVTWLLD